MIRKGRGSVKQLAATLFARGDLYANAGKPTVDAEEGIATQKKIQQIRAQQYPEYAREIALQLNLKVADQAWKIKGRVDGVFHDGQQLVVEEFKTCREFPLSPEPIDQGQCLLYAMLLTQKDPEQALKLPAEWVAELQSPTAQIISRLIYIDADTLAEKRFDQLHAVATYREFLAFTSLVLQARWQRHKARISSRDQWKRNLPFPMPTFRAGQQAVARRVYQALSRDDHLLLEAPTGSGKSLAVLYPGIRALQAEAQLFFLTSRNLGAAAALQAAKQIAPTAKANLSVVEITAKEKICPVPGMPCNADCDYAHGYFDRVGEAVNHALAEGIVTRAVVADLAEQHKVCPFELSLDVSQWADLIIGDYNYIFDPVVRLNRFTNHSSLHLLIDEAHQLTPRLQDMLKVELRRGDLRRSVQQADPLIDKRLASIDRVFAKLRRTYGIGEHPVPDFNSLERAIKKFVEVIAETHRDLTSSPELRHFFHACVRWQRAQQWVEEETFARIVEITQHTVNVRQVCLDVAPWFDHVTAAHGACVRFSATLTPLQVYQKLHGLTADNAERGSSPFDPSQSKILIVRDIPTYYQQRSRSLAKLAQLLCSIASLRPGRYLVALPSYAYLEQLAEALKTDTQVLQQRSGMQGTELDALMQAFTHSSEAFLLVVMGGALGESVDFVGIRLQGVFVVGLGLPPPSLERDLTAEYFEQKENNGWGQRIAYTQPALSKIQQAAGRLIRDPGDRGVICLIDPRFASPEIKSFLPAHWQPIITTAQGAVDEAASFWHQATLEKISSDI